MSKMSSLLHKAVASPAPFKKYLAKFFIRDHFVYECTVVQGIEPISSSSMKRTHIFCEWNFQSFLFSSLIRPLYIKQNA